MEEKAKEQGYLLIKKKNSNRANFSQVIHENIEPIVRQGYLSMNELGFLIAIQPFMEYQINAIMDKERNTFMTISDIASYLNRDRTGVSSIITTLLGKGILFEFVNIHDIKKFNRSISPRTLFVNPELFYSGDRNKVDGTLSTLVSNNDKLEKNNIKLNWKLWRKQGYSFGRL